jgi:hypothetical protein
MTKLLTGILGFLLILAKVSCTEEDACRELPDGSPDLACTSFQVGIAVDYDQFPYPTKCTAQENVRMEQRLASHIISLADDYYMTNDITLTPFLEIEPADIHLESLSNRVCQSFAVHARTTITFAGVRSTIHGGDVGVSPGTAITGAYQFEDGGARQGNSGDFAAHALTAHADALAIREDATNIAIEIGGKTFTPGTYRSGSAINIAYGTVVTLDGLNQPNPVFLFQAGTTLITAAGTSFILKNGASAENVVWALGTAATLGASSVVEGSILAGTAITFGTGSELRGCALAGSAVTFASQGSIEVTEQNRNRELYWGGEFFYFVSAHMSCISCGRDDGDGRARRLRTSVDTEFECYMSEMLTLAMRLEVRESGEEAGCFGNWNYMEIVFQEKTRSNLRGGQ